MKLNQLPAAGHIPFLAGGLMANDTVNAAAFVCSSIALGMVASGGLRLEQATAVMAGPFLLGALAHLLSERLRRRAYLQAHVVAPLAIAGCLLLAGASLPLLAGDRLLPLLVVAGGLPIASLGAIESLSASAFARRARPLIYRLHHTAFVVTPILIGVSATGLVSGATAVGAAGGMLLAACWRLLLLKPKAATQSAAPQWDPDTLWFMFFSANSRGLQKGLIAIMLVMAFVLVGNSSGWLVLPALAGIAAAAVAHAHGDRAARTIGGIRTLLAVFGILAFAAISYALVAGWNPVTPHLGAAVPTGVILSLCLVSIIAATAVGAADGALGHLTAVRFRKDADAIQGPMWFAEHIGCGIYIASMAMSLWATNSLIGTFMFIAVMQIVALIGLVAVKNRWRTTWAAASQRI